MELVNRMYTVFISGFRKDFKLVENAVAHADLQYSLRSVSSTGFVECEGVYKGTKELSYVGHVYDLFTVAALLGIAKRYKQESILVVDWEDNAFLFYTDGTMEYIGRMYSQKLMGNELDIGQDSYTIIPSTNRVYYTI